MINQKIDYFYFWTPIAFDQKPPGTHFLTTLAWQMGSFSDQLTYLGNWTLQFKAERIDAHKISFELTTVKQIPLWQTALKVSLYGLTLFMVYTIPAVVLVPAFILTAKIIFKVYLNKCKTLIKKSSPTPIPSPVGVKQFHTVESLSEVKQLHTVEKPSEVKPSNTVIQEKRFGKTKVVLLTGDLMQETTDAIVNPANKNLRAGAGVCGVIYSSTGAKPFQECENILINLNRRWLPCGQAVLTTTGNLPSTIKYIIHTPGPNCGITNENKAKDRLLIQTYHNSLSLALNSEYKQRYVSSKVNQPISLRSIAFPSISTGIFGFPLDEAAPIAVNTVKEFVEKYPDALDEVHFVCLPAEKDPTTLSAYQKSLDECQPSTKKDLKLPTANEIKQRSYSF